MAYNLPTTLAEYDKITGYTPKNVVGLRQDVSRPAQTIAPKQPSFAQSVAHTVGSVGGALAKGLYHSVVQAPINLVHGVQTNLGLKARANAAEQHRQALDAKDMQMHKDFKANKLTRAQFQAGQKQLIKDYQGVSGEAGKVNTDHYGYGKAAGDIASTGLTVASLAAPFLKAGALPGVLADSALGAKAAGAVDASLAVGKGSSVARKAAIGVANNALAVQPTVNVAKAIPTDLSKGNYAGAAGNAAMLAAPGIIGAAAKFAPKIASAANTAVFGKQGFYDAIKHAGGPDMLAHLDSLPAGAAKTKVENTLRQVQQYNMDQIGNSNAQHAGQNFVQYLTENGRDVKNIAPSDMAKELKNWTDANIIANKAQAAGKYLTPGSTKQVKVPNPEFMAASKEVPSAPVVKGPSTDLPKELSGAKPNYNYGSKNFQLQFPDGVTKALYIVANDAKRSTSDGKYMQFLSNHFPDKSEAEVRAMGQDIRNEIKNKAKGSEPGNLSVGSRNPTPPEILATGKSVPTPPSNIPATISKTVTTPGAPAKLAPGERVIAARFDSHAKNNLRDQLMAADGPSGRLQVLEQQGRGGADYTKNPTLMSRLANEVGKNDAEWKSGFEKVTSKVALQDLNAGMKLPGGYIAATTKNARADFKDVGNTEQLVRGSAPSKLLGGLSNKLERLGLSPHSTNSKQIKVALDTAFSNRLAEQGIEADSKKVMSALREVDKRGANDARMLSKNDVKGALGGVAPGVDPAKVLKALRNAYADVPKNLIGAGPAVLNKAIKKAPVLGTYLRLEQAGRYDSGLLSAPFRIKQAIKSGLVSVGEGNRGVRATHEDSTFLQSHGYFNHGGPGQDAGLGTETVGQQGSRLMNPELQRMVENTAASVAKAHNTTVTKLFENGGPMAKELDQSLRLITGYGKGGYLNSPLAKTLNLIIFPSRFETKVAMEATKALVKLPAAGQVAAVSGIANATSFLNSDKGKQWAKENSEAIGLIKAFTPLQTIENVHNFFTKGGHVGDLGELGGLPIGVLTSMLEHQGVNLGKLGTSQYVDPKTGKPVPENIPNTMKARAQQALTDLVGSMYSYPGKTAGLSSKTKVTQTVLPPLKPDAGSTTPKLKDGTTPAPESTLKAGSRLNAAQAANNAAIAKQAQPKTVVGAIDRAKAASAVAKTAKKPRAPKVKIKAFRPRPF